MFRYYLKIFWNKNSPNKFNGSILFPFIGTILSTISIIVIYCIMNSMESYIKQAIVSIDGESSIYVLDCNYKDCDNQVKNIQKYLDSKHIESQIVVNRIALLKFYNQSKIVNVVGLKDLNFLENFFEISINRNDFEKGVLIGQDLFEELGRPAKEDSLLILAPLDAAPFVNGEFFQVLDQNIEFENPNSIMDISSEYIFIDYYKALNIFSLARPQINIDTQLDSSTINYIKQNIENILYEDWRDKKPLFFKAIKLEKLLYSGFGLIIALIVAFNIYGLVNLIIYRKKNQLSLMLYLGATKKQIKSIFHCNILGLGFLGTLIGSIISVLIIESNFLVNKGFLPMLKEISIYYPIIFFSIIFNLLTLYFSSKISISKNIKNIGVLKSNAIES